MIKHKYPITTCATPPLPYASGCSHEWLYSCTHVCRPSIVYASHKCQAVATSVLECVYTFGYRCAAIPTVS